MEDWHHQFSHAVRAAFELGFFPCLQWIKDHKIFIRVKCFAYKADQISTDLTGCLIIDSVNGLVARIGNLFCILRQLNLRYEFAILCLDSSKFIYASE